LTPFLTRVREIERPGPHIAEAKDALMSIVNLEKQMMQFRPRSRGGSKANPAFQAA
jgi:hypothetical protein